MEGLQLAQMLADLSSLNEADPPATSALLNATKTVDNAIEKVSTIEKVSADKPHPLPQHTIRPALPRTSSSASSPGGPLDRLGRHVFGSQPPSRPGSVAATTPGTPTQARDVSDDVDKASTLLALQEIRAKLKQQDNTSLMKAREKINALAARQHAIEAANNRKPKYTYPK